MKSKRINFNNIAGKIIGLKIAFFAKMKNNNFFIAYF